MCVLVTRFYCFLWAFFYAYDPNMFSSTYRMHSTAAQRSQPCTKQQSKYAPTRARQSKQSQYVHRAVKSWREPACRRACTDRCVIKTNEEIENRPPACKNIYLVYMRPLTTAGVMREGFGFISHLCKIPHMPLFLSHMRAGSGSFSWSIELLLAFANRRLTPKTVGLSVRSVRTIFYSSP